MDCNFITTSSIYLTFYVAWNKFKAKVWPKLCTKDIFILKEDFIKSQLIILQRSNVINRA